MIDLAKNVKMWAVNSISFSPNYDTGGADEYKSVVFVTASEKTAKNFVDTEMKRRNSVWSDEYEYEEVEVR